MLASFHFPTWAVLFRSQCARFHIALHRPARPLSVGQLSCVRILVWSTVLFFRPCFQLGTPVPNLAPGVRMIHSIAVCVPLPYIVGRSWYRSAHIVPLQLVLFNSHCFFLGQTAKRGTPPPKTLTKRGTLLLVDREVFDVHVVVGINSTAKQDVCASTVHYYLYIHHCIRTAKHPTVCGAITLLSKKPNVRMGNISHLRSASVCFVQEEPHNIPCILNGGRT